MAQGRWQAARPGRDNETGGSERRNGACRPALVFYPMAASKRSLPGTNSRAHARSGTTRVLSSSSPGLRHHAHGPPGTRAREVNEDHPEELARGGELVGHEAGEERTNRSGLLPIRAPAPHLSLSATVRPSRSTSTIAGRCHPLLLLCVPRHTQTCCSPVGPRPCCLLRPCAPPDPEERGLLRPATASH